MSEQVSGKLFRITLQIGTIAGLIDTATKAGNRLKNADGIIFPEAEIQHQAHQQVTDMIQKNAWHYHQLGLF